MSYVIAGLQVALVLFGAGAGAAQAQTRPADTDDWAYVQDRPRELSVASVSYSTGVTLSVQCLSGNLLVAITGLPANAASIRRYDRRVGDGRVEQTTWRRSANGAGITNDSARLVRTFRRGGRLELVGAAPGAAPVEITLDLPTQSMNIDRVLTACGAPVSDAFDGALAIGDLLLEAPRVRLPQPMFQSYVAGRVTLECRVTNGRLTACRAIKLESAGPELAADAVRAANGTRLRLRDRQAAEGRVVEFVTSNIGPE